MEPSLIEMFQFVVRKDMHLTWPRGETPTHYIVKGMDEELVVDQDRLADFRITQLVECKKGRARHDFEIDFPTGYRPSLIKDRRRQDLWRLLVHRAGLRAAHSSGANCLWRGTRLQ
jgi:hypothetical protein